MRTRAPPSRTTCSRRRRTRTAPRTGLCWTRDGHGPAALYGAASSVAAVGAVTGSIFAVRQYVPVLSLGVLYLPAVEPRVILSSVPYQLFR